MNPKKQSGFTIVELLIVIVVIGILAALVLNSFTNAQKQARDTDRINNIANLRKAIERYAAENSSYPSTGSLNTVYADPGCPISDSARTDYIPGLAPAYIAALPDPANTLGARPGSPAGCYEYSSDGTNYVLSAWDLAESGPQTKTFYRRLGFRETSIADQNYICNHINIGGKSSGTYVEMQDYYKYSFTVTSLSNCNETMP